MGGKTSKNRRVPDSSRWIFGFFSKRAPSLGGWKNFKEPPGSRQFEVDIWFFFKTRLRTTEISTLIPTATDRLTAHWLTDQRALVEIIQRPSVWAGYPIQNLSVRPDRLKRRTVVSDRRTHELRYARSPHLQSNVFKDLRKRKQQLGLACNANSFRVCIGIASLSTQEETCLIPQNCPSTLHIPTRILERWPQRITLMSIKRSQYPWLR